MSMRILPMVMMAAGLLLVLKVGGLAMDGRYAMPAPEAPENARATYRPAASAGNGAVPQSWMSYRDLDEDIVTGSVPAKADKPEAPEAPALPPPGVVIPPEGLPRSSDGERALNERLQQRRQELDARSRELDSRESMMQVAEKRIEERLAALKAQEENLKEAEGEQAAKEQARLKDLVVMYENMRAKDAARIFDRLDLAILTEVVKQMNPRKSGEIIARMSPQAAERLTVALARPGDTAAVPANQLPKIQPRPQP